MNKIKLKAAGIVVTILIGASFCALANSLSKVYLSVELFKDFKKQQIDNPYGHTNVNVSINNQGVTILLSGVQSQDKQTELHADEASLLIPLKNGDCTVQYKEGVARNKILVDLLIKSEDANNVGTIDSKYAYVCKYMGEPLDLKQAAVFHDVANNKSRIHIPFKPSADVIPMQSESAQ